MLNKKSTLEKLFTILFFPIIVGMYIVVKYPEWIVPKNQVTDYFFFFGKGPSFWYGTLYTVFVCGMCLLVLFKGRSPYSRQKKKLLLPYQKAKWISIFFAQLIAFYFIPFYLPYLLKGESFFNDTFGNLNKDAYVYVYNGFTSWKGFIWIFLLVPLSVWFFGKRYCSWFCACGNLAEVTGVTSWGKKWVQFNTPRGDTSRKLESLQYFFLAFAIVFGFVLFFDGMKIVFAQNLVQALRASQDFVVDFIFGALIGVGAYPFLGTRIWCRYGCPLAGMMRIFGKYGHSNFSVKANEKCKGLGLCSQVCPMGINVEDYAHKDKKPIMGSFGLMETTCVGCGGCIDICPVDALSFKKVL